MDLGLKGKRQKNLGGIDIVVNNTSASASPEWTEDAWRRNFEIDLMGAVVMTTAVLRKKLAFRPMALPF